MSKNILQDVMPPKRRSIRDIPLNNKKKKKTTKPIEEPIVVNDSETSEEDNLSNFSGPIEGIRSSQKKEGGGKMKWWLLLITIIIVCGFLFSTVFSGAKVKIFPKQEKINLSVNITAVKSGASGVPFSILSIEGESSRAAMNFEEKEVTKQASGEIIIFNEYDSSPQRLVIRTRFETPDGKIYRIPKSVTVPGTTVDENGKITPGSIKVTVVADSPGSEYNVGLTDFTIPGFKGSDRFSKFYARSKTSMTGGYSGVMRVVDENELEQLRGEAHLDLDSELTADIYSQVPEGSVLYSDGIYISYESQENIDLENSVKILEKGILTAVVFDKVALSKYVADNISSGLESENVEILNIEDLTFKIFDKEYVDVVNDDNFDFSLEGLSHFVAVFDEEKIKNNLAGQPKKNINSVLLKYSGIEEAEITLSPFWKRSFPENIEKIEIERDLGLENN